MFKLKLFKSIARFSRNLSLAAIVCSVSIVGTIDAAKSAELNVRLGEDFTTLDPAFWQSGADYTMINVLFPKLIEFKSGSDWEYELQAAESIKQVDELTIKFKLKPGFCEVKVSRMSIGALSRLRSQIQLSGQTEVPITSKQAAPVVTKTSKNAAQ